MLFHRTPRATGGEFWDSKGWQGSVAPFLCLKHHHPIADSNGRTPMLCSYLGGSAGLAAVHTAHPDGEPIETLFLPAHGRPATTGFLPSCRTDCQLLAAGLCTWPFEFSSLLASLFIPSCPSLDTSMHGSLRPASILTGSP